MPSIRWTTLTLDCLDAEALGVFYSDLFGWEITARHGKGWLQGTATELRAVPNLWPLRDLAISGPWDFSVVRFQHVLQRPD